MDARQHCTSPPDIFRIRATEKELKYPINEILPRLTGKTPVNRVLIPMRLGKSRLKT
jgi:hypothetical protein